MSALSSASIPSSYACIIGGAQVSRTLWKQVQTVLKIEAPSIGYGATEASPGVTHLAPGREPLEDGEVGSFLPHLKTEFVDEGLRFEGPSLCMCILTAEGAQFPSFHVIHDQLRQRADGSLVYQGRLDLVLNRGGEKFHLAQMERELRQQFEIEPVCLAIEDARLGQELALAVQGVPV